MSGTAPLRVLVAVDFGEASATALWVATGLAARAGGRVTVLHAETIEAPPYFTPGQIDALERERQVVRARAVSFTREFASLHGSSDVNAIVTDGPAADAILEHASEADVLVLGTHGYRGPRRWWLGSVAERAVRASPVPVLVVHAVDTRAGRWAPTRIVALGANADAARAAWAELTGEAWSGPVDAAESVATCPRDGLNSESLIVQFLPPTAGGHQLPSGVDQLLTGCTAPVLFLPGSRPDTTRRP